MPGGRPNIVYVMADDHAANAISAYRSRLASVCRTPNIDRIGDEGARLRNAFCANAICTPSRATILTGQHSHVNGVRTLVDALDVRRPTFPALLRRAGYQTAVIGKWHLHSEPQGFDHYEILPIHGRYRDPSFLDPSFDWATYHQDTAESRGTRHRGHVTDLITDKSLAWLRRRDRDRPFLLLCHHKAPHDDFEYQQRFTGLFDGVTIPEPDSLWDNQQHGSVGSRRYGSSVSERNPVRNAVHRMSQWGHPTGRLDVRELDHRGRTSAAYQKYLKDYLRTAQGLDESVGAMLDYLDTDGIADDTVVIYTSDQGMFLGEHDYLDKRWMYEESMRMPFLIRAPGRIRAGSVVDRLVSNVDFAPTLLDLAGLPVPGSMQGRSFVPLLAGRNPADWPDLVYYRYWMHLADHDNPAHFGIRTPDYKLIFFYGLPLDATGAVPEPTPPSWELYDLRHDPAELHNVYEAPEYAEQYRELTDTLLAVRRDLGDEDARFPEVARRMWSTALPGR